MELFKLEVSTVLSLPLVSILLAMPVWHQPDHLWITQCKASNCSVMKVVAKTAAKRQGWLLLQVIWNCSKLFEFLWLCKIPKTCKPWLICSNVNNCLTSSSRLDDVTSEVHSTNILWNQFKRPRLKSWGYLESFSFTPLPGMTANAASTDSNSNKSCG